MHMEKATMELERRIWLELGVWLSEKVSMLQKTNETGMSDWAGVPV
jgi:hypothetical protein